MQKAIGLYTVVFLMLLLSTRTVAQSSILSTGYWVKINVEESGAYKFHLDTLRGWGFENPNNISIFSTFETIRLNDTCAKKLIEVPIQKVENGTETYYQTFLRGVKSVTNYKGVDYSSTSQDHRYFYYYIRQNNGNQTCLKVDSVPFNGETNNLSKTFDHKSFVLFQSHPDGYSLKDGALTFSPNFEYLDYKNQLDSNHLYLDFEHYNNDDTIVVEINNHVYKNRVDGALNIEIPYEKKIERISIYCIEPKSEVKIAHLYVYLFMEHRYDGNNAFFYGHPFYLMPSSSNIKVKLNHKTPLVWNVNYPNMHPFFVRTRVENDTLIIRNDLNKRMGYYLFDADSLKYPVFDQVVENQDLYNSPNCEYLIIAADSFYNQALKIAQLHEKYNKFSTLVVKQSLIYNDYAGGQPNLYALYGFCRSIFKKGSNENRLKYILLVGDGQLNARYLDVNTQILTYKPDYYGDLFLSVLSSDTMIFMDELTDYKKDVAVGRIPAQNKSDLDIYIAKLTAKHKETRISYMHQLYVADKFDDFKGDDFWDPYQLSPADSLNDVVANYLKSVPNVVVHKTYFAAESNVAAVNSDIIRHINNGLGFVCYNGHANHNGWNMGVMDKSVIKNFKNKQYPIVFTIGCAYAPIGQYKSYAAYDWLFNPGGAIGVVGLTQPSPIVDAYHFLRSYFMNWGKNCESSVGDVFNKTIATNRYSDWAILGDPAAMFRLPEYGIDLTKSVSNTLQGTITTHAGSPAENFHGSAVMQIMQNPFLFTAMYNRPLTYMVYDSIFFSDTAAVVDGKFQFSLSDNVSKNMWNKKISIYALSADSLMEAYNANLLFENVKPTSVQLGLRLYPNPFVDKIVLESELFSQSETQLTIRTFDGKIIMQQSNSITNNSIVINTSAIPVGIYLLSIHNKNNSQTVKIVKTY